MSGRRIKQKKVEKGRTRSRVRASRGRVTPSASRSVSRTRQRLPTASKPIASASKSKRAASKRTVSVSRTASKPTASKPTRGGKHSAKRPAVVKPRKRAPISMPIPNGLTVVEFAARFGLKESTLIQITSLLSSASAAFEEKIDDSKLVTEATDSSSALTTRRLDKARRKAKTKKKRNGYFVLLRRGHDDDEDGWSRHSVEVLGFECFLQYVLCDMESYEEKAALRAYVHQWHAHCGYKDSDCKLGPGTQWDFFNSFANMFMGATAKSTLKTEVTVLLERYQNIGLALDKIRGQLVTKGGCKQVALEYAKQMVDMFYLQPDSFMKKMLPSSWSKADVVFFKEVVLPDIGKLLGAVGVDGQEYDALDLACIFGNDVARECLFASQPTHLEKPTLDLVCARSLARHSLEELGAAATSFSQMNGKVFIASIRQCIDFDLKEFDVGIVQMADEFDFRDIRNDAIWRRLRKAGFKLEPRHLDEAFNLTATSGTVSFGTCNWVLNCFPTDALKKAAVCELMGDSKGMDKLVTYNCHRTDFPTMLDTFHSMAPKAYNAAMLRPSGRLLPAMNYVLAVDRFNADVMCRLWPSDVTLLFSNPNIFQVCAKGAALKLRDDKGINWLKGSLGDKVLKDPSTEPMTTFYLKMGGSNCRVLEALFAEKRMSYLTGDNVFHVIVEFSLSLPIVLTMRRLLGEDLTDVLLRIQDAGGHTAYALAEMEQIKRQGKMNEVSKRLLDAFRPTH